MNWLKSLWNFLVTPTPRPQPVTVTKAWKPLTVRGSDETMSNFTPRAQQVLALARQEADRLNHNFVGTEHLLLGLIRLNQGCAVKVFARLRLDLETVRLEVEKQIGAGIEKPQGFIPFTPRVKKTLALAAKETRTLGHTYLGTEHILLGLLTEGDGVAARVLKNLNLDANTIRIEILRELDPNGPSADPAGSPQVNATPPPRTVTAPTPRSDLIDTSKRYDIYCSDRNQEVVYRNALFKGKKSLLPKNQHDIRSEYLEIEQLDGQTIFVSGFSVIRFCEPGVTPKPETPPGNKS